MRFYNSSPINGYMFNLVPNPSELIVEIIYGVFCLKCLYFAKT